MSAKVTAKPTCDHCRPWQPKHKDPLPIVARWFDPASA